jgi:hypothetical protein
MAVKNRFKVRYWHFKSLLRLNERAMVILSLMEQAAQQSRPIGMPFIRGHITSLSIHVYKIIQELNQLSDHGYPGLFEAFERIQEALQALLSPPSPEHSGPLIRPVEDLSKDDAEKAGRIRKSTGFFSPVIRRIFPNCWKQAAAVAADTGGTVGQIDMIMGSRKRARAYKLKRLSDMRKEIFS